MNDDHADAIVAYAHHFANASDVTEATMTAIDATGMDLTTNGSSQKLRIPFDHELQDAQDARVTLIAMAQTATPRDQSTTATPNHTHERQTTITHTHDSR
jgi:putative heme iron utilization protein